MPYYPPSRGQSRIKYNVWLEPEVYTLLDEMADYSTNGNRAVVMRQLIQAAHLQFMRFRDAHPDKRRVDFVGGNEVLIWLEPWYKPEAFAEYLHREEVYKDKLKKQAELKAQANQNKFVDREELPELPGQGNANEPGAEWPEEPVGMGLGLGELADWRREAQAIRPINYPLWLKVAAVLALVISWFIILKQIFG